MVWLYPPAKQVLEKVLFNFYTSHVVACYIASCTDIMLWLTTSFFSTYFAELSDGVPFTSVPLSVKKTTETGKIEIPQLQLAPCCKKPAGAVRQSSTLPADPLDDFLRLRGFEGKPSSNALGASVPHCTGHSAGSSGSTKSGKICLDLFTNS